MDKVERRYQVNLTKSEVESIIKFLRLYGAHFEDVLIERFERRLRQIQSHEEMESRLSLDPEIQVGI
tara:strand:- start:1811 stop:2011 length:201 start_codon:yes stop_codon:yes gene_type:complete